MKVKFFFLLATFLFQSLNAQAACKNLLNKSSTDNFINKICDDNKDLVADDANIKNDNTIKSINLAFATIEDANFYEQVYGNFINHLSKCMKIPVLTYPVYDEKNIVEAMKLGRVHIASFGAGATMKAVNESAAIPFASRGLNGVQEHYQLYLIVKKDSNFNFAKDLKGKKIAHVTPSSVSGNLAPRALFPELGLIPDIDYKVEFSGRHDKSILGVKNGFYDAAAVASDVFKRQNNQSDFKILWKSENFPTNSFSYNNFIDKKTKKNIQTCFFQYKFPDNLALKLGGNNEFVPVNYLRDWKNIRKVAQKAIANTNINNSNKK